MHLNRPIETTPCTATKKQMKYIRRIVEDGQDEIERRETYRSILKEKQEMQIFYPSWGVDQGGALHGTLEKRESQFLFQSTMEIGEERSNLQEQHTEYEEDGKASGRSNVEDCHGRLLDPSGRLTVKKGRRRGRVR